MSICPTIRNCHIATFHNHGGVLISVGVLFRGAERFVTCCVQDPLGGCQHINTRDCGAMVIIERVARALRAAGADPA